MKQALDAGSLSSTHIGSPVAQPINQDASAYAWLLNGASARLIAAGDSVSPRQPNLTMRRAWTHCSPGSATICAHTQVGLTSSEPRPRQTSCSAAPIADDFRPTARTRCNWRCDRIPRLPASRAPNISNEPVAGDIRWIRRRTALDSATSCYPMQFRRGISLRLDRSAPSTRNVWFRQAEPGMPLSRTAHLVARNAKRAS